MAWALDELAELKRVTFDASSLKVSDIITDEEAAELTRWEQTNLKALETEVYIPKTVTLMATAASKGKSLAKWSAFPRRVWAKKIIVSMVDLVSWLEAVARSLNYTDRTQIKIGFSYLIEKRLHNRTTDPTDDDDEFQKTGDGLVYVFGAGDAASFSTILTNYGDNNAGRQFKEFIDKSFGEFGDNLGGLLSHVYEQSQFTASWRESSFQPYRLISATIWVRVLLLLASLELIVKIYKPM